MDKGRREEGTQRQCAKSVKGSGKMKFIVVRVQCTCIPGQKEQGAMADSWQMREDVGERAEGRKGGLASSIVDALLPKRQNPD